MKSLKRHENYLLIDHTFSPGVPDSLLVTVPDAITSPAGKKLEAAFYTCSHCQTDVIKRPERTRARGYCPSCDHVICDRCEGIKAIHGCLPMKKVIDDLQETAFRNLNLGEI